MKADVCFKLMGKYISFFIGKEEKLGRIIQVRIDTNDRMLVGIDENGYVEEYEVADVQVSDNKNKHKTLTKQIIKKVNKEINSFKFDLGEYHKESIITILQKIDSERVRNDIIKSFDTGEKNDSRDEIYKSILQQSLEETDAELLLGIVAYKTHDINTAYKIFRQRWIKDKDNPDICRDFILVADEFDNDVLCFYLLKHFFETNGRYINERYYINLWWKYLYYAVKYNNFDLLSKIKITEWNARVLLDSFIYIFYMYNMEHIAEGLINCFAEGNNTILQQNNEDLGNINSTIDELNLCRNYIPDTAEGYYLRFEACMEGIVEAYNKGSVNTEGDERSGYIYEYVKSRNYGFIIGYDFQKYFYHWDDLNSNIRKRVMDNIYSDKDIKDEDKIYVQFRQELINKKIQAADII